MAAPVDPWALHRRMATFEYDIVPWHDCERRPTGTGGLLVYLPDFVGCREGERVVPDRTRPDSMRFVTKPPDTLPLTICQRSPGVPPTKVLRFDGGDGKDHDVTISDIVGVLRNAHFGVLSPITGPGGSFRYYVRDARGECWIANGRLCQAVLGGKNVLTPQQWAQTALLGNRVFRDGSRPTDPRNLPDRPVINDHVYYKRVAMSLGDPPTTHTERVCRMLNCPPSDGHPVVRAGANPASVRRRKAPGSAASDDCDDAADKMRPRKRRSTGPRHTASTHRSDSNAGSGASSSASSSASSGASSSASSGASSGASSSASSGASSGASSSSSSGASSGSSSSSGDGARFSASGCGGAIIGSANVGTSSGASDGSSGGTSIGSIGSGSAAGGASIGASSCGASGNDVIAGASPPADASDTFRALAELRRRCPRTGACVDDVSKDVDAGNRIIDFGLQSEDDIRKRTQALRADPDTTLDAHDPVLRTLVRAARTHVSAMLDTALVEQRALAMCDPSYLLSLCAHVRNFQTLGDALASRPGTDAMWKVLVMLRLMDDTAASPVPTISVVAGVDMLRHLN